MVSDVVSKVKRLFDFGASGGFAVVLASAVLLGELALATRATLQTLEFAVERFHSDY